MGKRQRKNIFDFISSVKQMDHRYQCSGSLEELSKTLSLLANDYGNFTGAGDHLLHLADEYIQSNDYPAGMLLIKTVNEGFRYIANTTLLNLRMAEYHIEKQETEIGIRYLIALCNSVDNYEESIRFNELTAVWNKYKPLVKGMIPLSVSFCSDMKPLKPDECSMKINDVFRLPAAELPEALAAHINELSANGSKLSCLNKTERLFYYIDELCSEVNSGGFESYLYYNGHHFQNAFSAIQAVKANRMVSLMDRVRSKFPKGEIPKSLKNIRETMDALEEKGINFEAEDARFYDADEQALLPALIEFIYENKARFR